jgi:transmembrane sensor
MEEPVTEALRDLMTEVASRQKDFFERRSSLSQLRVRPPLRVAVRPRPRRALVLLAPALGAAGLALGLWWLRPPRPLTFAIALDGAGAGDGDARVGTATGTVAASATPGRPGEALAAGARALSLDFSDGSRVELAPDTTARVAELDDAGAEVILEDGRARVSVKHRARTHWMFEAGPFEVRVTGTRFSLAWNRTAESLTVAMTEGTVEISSRLLPDAAPVRVTAGQRYSASRERGRWSVDPLSAPVVGPAERAGATAPPAPAAEPRREPTEEPAVDRPVGPVVAGTDADVGTSSSGGAPGRTARLFANGTRRWQILARRGRYQEALDSVEQGGGFTATSRRLGPEELVQLGDVARLAGSIARAEQAYKLARRRFPRMDRPVFGLGLVAFEQRHDYRAAASWFETYGRRFPSGPLRDEAAGRAMESWQRAGDGARAAAAATDYLRRAPTGPYAPLARRIAGP